MTQYQTIDGNPAETVGETRMLAAEESDNGERLRITSVPRRWLAVLADHLEGSHVLVLMFVSLGAEAIVFTLADAMFPRIDLQWFFGGIAIATIVFLMVVFVAVVWSNDDEVDEDDGRPTSLTVDAERYRIDKTGWFGERTVLEGETWDLLEELDRVNRSRVGFSTKWIATLRPTASLQSYLIAGMTERDRTWLARQFETDD